MKKKRHSNFEGTQSAKLISIILDNPNFYKRISSKIKRTENSKEKTKIQKPNFFHINKKETTIFSIEKKINQKFHNKYINQPNIYNIQIINDIFNNTNNHFVSVFKDFLIYREIYEFINKLYSIKESKNYLQKILNYYHFNCIIFPNYVVLPEKKYIYKNISKKQKLIDLIHDNHKDILKNCYIDNDEMIFNDNIITNILNQTNTSNIKKIFGLKKEKDSNLSTINDIVSVLDNIDNVNNNNETKNKNNQKNINNNQNVNFNNFFNNINHNKNKEIDLKKEQNKKNNNTDYAQKKKYTYYKDICLKFFQKMKYKDLNTDENFNYTHKKSKSKSKNKNYNINYKDSMLLFEKKKKNNNNKNLNHKSKFKSYSGLEIKIDKKDNNKPFSSLFAYKEKMISKKKTSSNINNKSKSCRSSISSNKEISTNIQKKLLLSSIQNKTNIKFPLKNIYHNSPKIIINDSNISPNSNKKNNNKDKSKDRTIIIRNTISNKTFYSSLIKDNNSKNIAISFDNKDKEKGYPISNNNNNNNNNTKKNSTGTNNNSNIIIYNNYKTKRSNSSNNRSKSKNLEKKIKNTLSFNIYKIQAFNSHKKKIKNINNSQSTGTMTGSYGRTSGKEKEIENMKNSKGKINFIWNPEMLSNIDSNNFQQNKKMANKIIAMSQNYTEFIKNKNKNNIYSPPLTNRVKESFKGALFEKFKKSGGGQNKTNNLFSQKDLKGNNHHIKSFYRSPLTTRTSQNTSAKKFKKYLKQNFCNESKKSKNGHLIQNNIIPSPSSSIKTIKQEINNNNKNCYIIPHSSTCNGCIKIQSIQNNNNLNNNAI